MHPSTSRFLKSAALTISVAAVGRADGSAGRPATRYRDVQVVTLSQPAEAEPARIEAQTRFRNRGTAPLRVHAHLAAHPEAGFSGADFEARIAPGESATWPWILMPPQPIARIVLEGRIDLDGIPERDLYIALQGPDPDDLDDPGIERITEAARVVATYAPRRHARILALLQEAADGRPAPLLTLAQNGRSDYVVVVPDLPAPPPDEAAPAVWARTLSRLTAAERDLVAALEDLRRIVELQSGALLPVTPIRPPDDRPLVEIALDAGFRPPDGLQDAYRLHTDGHAIRIRAATLDGLRQGIYGLLTDHLEAHWFQPRRLGEEIGIPADRTVRLPALDETRGSRWFSVTGVSWGGAPRWDRRNRALVNRGRMSFGHAWERYIHAAEFPYDRYPEYYARDRQDNLRRRVGSSVAPNFCSTHPDVLDIVARKVNAAFDADPARIVVSLDPNDYAPMCLCNRCLALDRQYGRTDDDGAEVADRLIHFSREIRDRLKPGHGDKYLGILIYGYQMELPLGAQPHERHAGMICNFPRRTDHSRPWNDPTSERNRNFHRLLTGWLERLPHLVYYDYYGHWFFFAPYAVVHKLREDLPAFHEMGGRSLMLEAQPNFAGQGLNHYIAARLAWDLETDIDLALETFFQRYYGPVAASMRNYWLTAERYFALERPGTYTETRVGLRPEFWEALDACLREAGRQAAGLPEAQRRFADRVAVNRLGFDYGRLRFEYESRFGSVAVRALRRKVDHAAAIDFLREHRAAFEQLQAHHSPHDEYWPPLVPSYFLVDIDALIARHQAARE